MVQNGMCMAYPLESVEPDYGGVPTIQSQAHCGKPRPVVHGGLTKPRRLDRRGFGCALDRIRTYDLLLRRQTLYPLSYEGNPGFLPLPAGRPRA